MTTKELRPGASFESPDVVAAYRHRPDYAAAIYDKLVAIAPGRSSLLDLGCGIGKISRRLSGHFQSVTAVDPSREMLRVASTQEASEPTRITWIHGFAEEATLVGAPFDLVVAAASIHWMNHAKVFLRLRQVVNTDHVFAVVDGDEPFNPPWQADWDAFLAYWIGELKGEVYEPKHATGSFRTWMNRYRSWMDVNGETAVISEPLRQGVEDFIASQHSCDTFASAKLGSRLGSFDAQLRALLTPYTEAHGLTYSVRSTVVWGTIRPEPVDVAS